MRRFTLSIALSLIGIVTWGGAPASAALADRDVRSESEWVYLPVQVQREVALPYMKRSDWMKSVACYTEYCVHQFRYPPSYGGGFGSHITYSWQIQAGSNGRICVQGQWNRDTTGRTWDTGWAPLGCGESGGGRLHWGPFLGEPSVRAKVQPGFLGSAYVWKF
ncbi:hypothetical protein [Nocardioides zhouii]|uniref:Secreted protein n=1 Tax=Nocardioides zhouii TaxID=1168729 RepID=A0A4Q2SK84_9ACTN|nr:hypothetical protein [Nocardioides zhouii]RYC05862.1 hypothetical protein EUA94_16530 [Nocardioides zhouii]